jgi:hypothetical protein
MLDELSSWTIPSPDPGIFEHGKRECPTDGAKLDLYTGKQVPKDMPVYRCETCKWWWWPADTLFKFKGHQEESIQQAKSKASGQTFALAAFLLPVMGLLVMVVGLGAGLNLLKNRQQVAVPAAESVRNFTATYVGDGIVLVRFETDTPLDIIEYREVGEGMWIEELVAPVVNRLGGYEVRIGKLGPGRYEVKIWEKVFEFEVEK